MQIQTSALSLALFVLLPFQLKAQVKSDLQTRNLKGNVLSITESSYTADEVFHKTKEEDGSVMLFIMDEYDYKGKIKSEFEFLPDSSFLQRTEFEYDAKGNETKKTYYNGPSQDNFNGSYTSAYDDKGNKITQTYFSNEGDPGEVTHYKYDDRGNETEESSGNNLYPDYTYSYNNLNQKIEEDDYLKGKMQNKDVYKYGDNNKISNDDQYDGNGNLDRLNSYTYDQSGNKIEVDGHLYDDGNYTLYFKITYKYDLAGNETERVEYWPTMGQKTYTIKTAVILTDKKGTIFKSSKFQKINTQFNNKGNVIKYEIYDGDDSLTFKSIAKVDVNGYITGWGGYNSKDSLEYKYVEKYNEKGNIIEETVYNGENKLLYKFDYKFDENGNKIGFNIIYSDDTVSNRYNYKYDSNGNKTEEDYASSDGKNTSKTIYQYDQKGNEIEEDESKNKEVSLSYKQTFTYDGFDSNGNWLKKTTRFLCVSTLFNRCQCCILAHYVIFEPSWV